MGFSNRVSKLTEMLLGNSGKESEAFSESDSAVDKSLNSKNTASKYQQNISVENKLVANSGASNSSDISASFNTSNEDAQPRLKAIVLPSLNSSSSSNTSNISSNFSKNVQSLRKRSELKEHLTEILEEESPERQKKIIKLKEEISSGNYDPDTRKIAESILSFGQDKNKTSDS